MNILLSRGTQDPEGFNAIDTARARPDCPSRVGRCDGLVCGSHSSAARAPASAGKCGAVVAAVFAGDVEEIDVHVVWCDAELV